MRQARLATALLPVVFSVVLPITAGEIRIKSATVLTTDGGRVDWSASKNLIAFDRANSNGFYQVWVMQPDGSGQTCLTCTNSPNNGLNVGNPAWHPSGNYLVVQAQKTVPLGPNGDQFARPGVGINNDIWIMDAQGTHYWQVTRVDTGNGVLHPHFSRSGNKLLWAERISGTPLPAGTWVMRLADFAVVNGTPTVSNIQTLTPGQTKLFYETHGFSPDDQTIYFSGYINPGQSPYAYNVYSYGLSTGALTDLTPSQAQWNEHAQINPAGDKIVWMSSEGQGIVPAQNPGSLITDYWAMNPDGTDKVRLSYYNDQLSPTFKSGGVAAGDNSWNADGTQLVAYLVNVGGGATLGGGGEIVVYQMEPAAATLSDASYLRQPFAPDSIVAAFGSGLAPSAMATPSTSLSTNLNGTTISVQDAKGNTQPALLYYVSPTQVNYVIPSGLAPGPAVATITSGSGSQMRGDLYIGTSPSLFTANANGKGVPAAYVVGVAANGSQSVNFVFDCSGGAGNCTPKTVTPAASTYLILFGTGIRHGSSVTVQVGGQSLPVASFGAQPQYPGLDQINVLIPNNLFGSGLVNVTVTVDGAQSNVVQIQL